MNSERDVFIDTSAFIALRVKDDINHTISQDFLTVTKDKKLRLHTTNFILVKFIQSPLKWESLS